jgi:hypothetical protein
MGSRSLDPLIPNAQITRIKVPKRKNAMHAIGMIDVEFKAAQ